MSTPTSSGAVTVDPGLDGPCLDDSQVDFLLSVRNQVEARRRARVIRDVADVLNARGGGSVTYNVVGCVVDVEDVPSDAHRLQSVREHPDPCPGHWVTVADLTGAIRIAVAGFVPGNAGRGDYRVKSREDCETCRMRASGYDGPVRTYHMAREADEYRSDHLWTGEVAPIALDPSWDDDFSVPDALADELEQDWYRPLRRRQSQGVTRARVPELLGKPPAALIYPGRRTLVSGKPDQGKTWLSLAAAADVIDRHRGFVLWFDCDALGDDLLIDRLTMLGVDDQAREDWFMVGRLESEQAGTGGVAKDLFPALVVFDGWNAALSQQGVAPTDETGVIEWQRRFIDPFLRQRPGCAVIVNDHVPQRSKIDHGYSFGAQGKVGQTDAHLRAGWAAGHRMDQETGRGKLEVRVMRDRFGGHHAGGYVIDLEPGGDPPFIVTRATLTTNPDVTDQVVSVLRDAPGSSTSAVERAVGRKGVAVVGALRMLEQAGRVTREAGPRRANLWTLVAGDGEGEME